MKKNTPEEIAEHLSLERAEQIRSWLYDSHELRDDTCPFYKVNPCDSTCDNPILCDLGFLGFRGYKAPKKKKGRSVRYCPCTQLSPRTVYKRVKEILKAYEILQEEKDNGSI